MEILIVGLKPTLHPVQVAQVEILLSKTVYMLSKLEVIKKFPGCGDGMLKVLHLDVYDLLDLGVTLSSVTPYIAMRFDGLLEVLSEPFSVSTPVGYSVVAKRVHRRCPISLSHRVTLIDLVELDMIDFDVILGMDWLHSSYAFIDCRTRVVKFQFPNELVLE
ncbi:hypothetical protein MTR67_017989 [Solanum verrucosum]|uniref:Gag-pol polyprotein n=1 Tax=Solanum verrucosum TaxID=315347 RepID=A0AAF0QRC8_SOLVR|nr:hypothetical protein MTR67_017989 [Solanum verrucosum]